MTSFDEIKDGYEIPGHWIMSAFYDAKYRYPIELISPYLKKTDVVLDVGCGDGKLTSLLAKKVKEVYGIDKLRRPLEFAKLLIVSKNVFLKEGNALDIPYQDEMFDVITAFDVIEHISTSEVRLFLKEAKRVLRPRGLFILTTPNRDELRGRLWGHKINKKHYFEFSLKEICKIIEDTGFEVANRKGIYIPLPIPYIEHYASVFPFRILFRFLIRLGRYYPTLCETILVVSKNIKEIGKTYE